MRLKEAILAVMQRDDLKTVVQDYELDGVDQRSGEAMAGALRTAKRVRVDGLLEYLGEPQVKEVCELCGVPSTGRRRALIERLIEARQQHLSSRVGGSSQDTAADEKAEQTETAVPDSAPQARWIELPRETSVPVLSIARPELVWPGKYDSHGNRVIDRGVALPFQVVETIKEGRATREPGRTGELFSAKPSKENEWRNKLIWGDNLLVMASLLEDFAGKVDLIYIDPPFATGADFNVTSVLGDDAIEVSKEQSIIEEKVYRDTWGAGVRSYLSMMCVRLHIIRDLLSKTGTLYLHCDYRTSHYLRILLEEVFGSEHFVAEIIWKRRSGIVKQTRTFGACTNTILMFSKEKDFLYNRQFTKVDSEDYVTERFKYVNEKGRRYRLSNLVNPGYRPTLRYEYKGYPPPPNGWAISAERMKQFDFEGRLEFPKDRKG